MTARVLVVDDVPANVKLMEARLKPPLDDRVYKSPGNDCRARPDHFEARLKRHARDNPRIKSGDGHDSAEVVRYDRKL